VPLRFTAGRSITEPAPLKQAHSHDSPWRSTTSSSTCSCRWWSLMSSWVERGVTEGLSRSVVDGASRKFHRLRLVESEWSVTPRPSARTGPSGFLSDRCESDGPNLILGLPSRPAQDWRRPGVKGSPIGRCIYRWIFPGCSGPFSTVSNRTWFS